MKVIRTYTRGKDISYQFPSTNKRWTVQFANNIRSISLVGQNNSGNTADQIQEIQTLDANLTCLNNYCFNQAVGLDDVYLSPQMKSINERCFNGCTGIRTVSYDIYETCAAGTTGKIPSLDHIGNYAFAQCTGMRSVTLPESINNASQIDSLAFAGSNLTSVTFLGITSDKLLTIQPDKPDEPDKPDKPDKPDEPKEHGDGNINNALFNVSNGFITGQWYKYGTNSNNFEQLINYANTSKIPMIFIASQFGCIHCANFKSNIQNNQQMISWYAESKCLLAYIYSGSGWWTSDDCKVFVNKIEGGEGTGMPTIGVWKNGKISWQQTGYSTSQSVQTMQNLFKAAIGG